MRGAFRRKHESSGTAEILDFSGVVLRFRRLLAATGEEPDRPWAQLAAEAGYADQAHMSREFVAFSGVTPGRYRRIGPDHELHLPV